MSVQLPIVFSNITSSQLVTQGGQQAIPTTYLDNDLNALANPVNPPIALTASIILTSSQSGNIYRIDTLSANITVTLSTTAGSNYTFIGNNSSSYTVTFNTTSGNILYNGTTNASVALSGALGHQYYVICDGTNWYIINNSTLANFNVTNNSTLYNLSVTNNATLANLNVTNNMTLNSLTVSALTLLSNWTANRTVRFTSNGTWTVPTGVTTIYVSGCGGGGGGGDTQSGGYGVFATLSPISVTAGHSLSITIGAAGTGTTSSYATSGGTTTIVDTTTSTTIATLNGGGAGNNGSTTVALPGASGPFGVGGLGGGTASGTAGGSAGGYGAGGGQGNSATGGNGAPGLIIIQW